MSINKREVLRKVNRGLDYQFQGSYSFLDMLKDCDLTADELAWASENVSYTCKAHIVRNKS